MSTPFLGCFFYALDKRFLLCYTSFNNYVNC